MVKIAVLLTGDVRDYDCKNDLIKYCNNLPVYHGTYSIHKSFIEGIGYPSKCVLVDPDKDIRYPYKLEKENMQQNMLQWLHLENILKKYREELQEYDIIIKFRYDCKLLKGDNFHIFDNFTFDRVIYQSDLIFVAHPKIFYQAFENFYDSIYETIDLSKQKISDDFKLSWQSDYAFKKNLKDKHIQNQAIYIVKIDRKNYKKRARRWE